ncbi:hypothetical protein FRC20_010673 [Serendipita sp. 405]|nr:hypothetical protein FRC20_010673 [Serendipita sp. 405]
MNKLAIPSLNSGQIRTANFMDGGVYNTCKYIQFHVSGIIWKMANFSVTEQLLAEESRNVTDSSQKRDREEDEPQPNKKPNPTKNENE